MKRAGKKKRTPKEHTSMTSFSERTEYDIRQYIFRTNTNARKVANARKSPLNRSHGYF